jgi:uncharacterized protein with HEPN domain
MARPRDGIIEAAERAVSYVEALTPEQFAADPRTIDAVSFAIVVIGEAANAVPESVMEAAPEIPWADIRGMRNRVSANREPPGFAPRAHARKG